MRVSECFGSAPFPFIRREAIYAVLTLFFHLATGYAYADFHQANQCSEDLSLWPRDAKVLSDSTPLSEDGKSNSQDSAVIHPTMKVYFPKAGSSGNSIIVFPGGGYKALAIGRDSTIGEDGSAVEKWLTDAGITCILLKSRVPYSGCYWNEKAKRHVAPRIPMALQDAQRAISVIRFHVKKYNLEPHRIGVISPEVFGAFIQRNACLQSRRAGLVLQESDDIPIHGWSSIFVDSNQLGNDRKRPRSIENRFDFDPSEELYLWKKRHFQRPTLIEARKIFVH